MTTVKNRWTIKPIDENAIQTLSEELKINPVLCRLLINRGIDTYDKAKEFFRPSLDKLHDPFLMLDMDKAVARVLEAIEKKEKIMVYGDYDVDGTTSVSLVYKFLKNFHSEIIYYIPDRYTEGYGVSTAGIEYADQEKVNLIIALDCGIKAVDKVAFANTKNIDFIICDHHLPGEVLPDAVAILDQKRKGCGYPYKELSGCGIGFKLIQALAPSLGADDALVFEALDLVAISIASDIVPITGENRVLAYFGLKKINENPLPGIKAMIDESGMGDKEMSIGDVVFKLGPRINAAGRMVHATAAVDVLLSVESLNADQTAKIIGSLNNDRKEADKDITQQAKDMVIEKGWEIRNSTVLYDPSWHKGVIGIVASRLIETYYRPTIILTKSGDKVAGSARSVSGFSVYDAIESCSDLLIQFGGHKYAAGLTMEESNVDAFIQKFEEVVSAAIDPDLLVPEIKIDGELDLNDLSLKFYEIIDQMSPFGPENMRPVFVSKNVMDTGYAQLLKEEHLKITVRQNNSDPIKGIGFFKKHLLKPVQEGPIDVVYSIMLNEWQGRRSVEMELKDIQSAT